MCLLQEMCIRDSIDYEESEKYCKSDGVKPYIQCEYAPAMGNSEGGFKAVSYTHLHSRSIGYRMEYLNTATFNLFFKTFILLKKIYLCVLLSKKIMRSCQSGAGTYWSSGRCICSC